MQDKYTKYRAHEQHRGASARRGGRSSAMTLYLSVGVSIVAALGTLMSVNLFFNLKSGGLQVNGSELYDSEQIRSVGGIVDGQNLIRMNTQYIADRLKSNLVYIDDVSIEKRYLDGGLTVKITEAVPYAQIEVGGSYCTLSESGRILECDVSERDKSMPLIVGYELKDSTPGVKAESKDSQKTEILTSIFQNLNEIGFEKIVKIDITDRTDIKLSYDNRIELCLGSSVDLDIKLSELKVVIDSGLPSGYVGSLVYLSQEDGISARPKEAEVPVQSADTSSEDDSSLDSSAEDAYGEFYGSDSSEDDGGYYDGNDGYGGDGDNYAGGYSDNGWDDGGYTDYGDYGYGTDDGGYDYGDNYGYDNYGWDGGSNY